MEKLWKIKLSDGTQIENLKLNGNNFVSEIEITEDDFRGKLSSVIIKQEDKVIQECNNMELVQIAHYKDGYYFVLREITKEELDKLKMQSDIEYLAMMTNVDMEEE